MARTTPPGPSGRDRLAQMQEQQRTKERKRGIALIAAGVAAVVAIGGGITYAATRDSDEKPATTSTKGLPAERTVDGISGMRVWSGLGRTHVEGDPTFPMNPPVGGNHNIAWANCGIYDKTIPNKYAVHSLEHGAVWITYTDKTSSSDVAALKKLAGQDYMLMSKDPTQDSPIVVSAWEHQIRATSASDPRIKKFIDAYLQGPQTPEPGAACAGAYDPNTGKIGGTM